MVMKLYLQSEKPSDQHIHEATGLNPDDDLYILRYKEMRNAWLDQMHSTLVDIGPVYQNTFGSLIEITPKGPYDKSDVDKLLASENPFRFKLVEMLEADAAGSHGF